MYPVLVITYNRPLAFATVLEALRGQPISEVFVFSDGPQNEVDHPAVMEVRELIQGLDIDRPVRTFFSEENLGCRRAVTTAIDWVFEHAEAAFILEDDCVPTADFFVVGNFILRRYAGDTRVSQFSGRHPPGVPERYFSGGAFGFDILGSTWGWATWKRAWDLFDRDSTALAAPAAQEILQGLSTSSRTRVAAVKRGYQAVVGGQVDTWDYHWAMGRLAGRSLAVIPARNLVANIGFGDDASHTKSLPFGVSPGAEKFARMPGLTFVKPNLSATMLKRVEQRHRLQRLRVVSARRGKRWMDKVYLVMVAMRRRIGD